MCPNSLLSVKEKETEITLTQCLPHIRQSGKEVK